MNLKRLGIGCLGVTVGAAAAVGWIATVALAVDLQPLAIAVAAAAAGLSWATWRVHRRLETITPRWDAAIREAIATLPKGTRVRRSKAGRGSPLTVLAMTIYVIGLFVAVPWAIVAPSHEGAGAPIWLVAGPGVVTGGLLAMGRGGGRGRGGAGGGGPPRFRSAGPQPASRRPRRQRARAGGVRDPTRPGLAVPIQPAHRGVAAAGPVRGTATGTGGRHRPSTCDRGGAHVSRLQAACASAARGPAGAGRSGLSAGRDLRAAVRRGGRRHPVELVAR